jgi:hypothetical protein
MALLAQNPGDRVDHIRLPAPVRPHNAGDPRATESDRGFLAKGLESKQLDLA